MRDDFDHDRFVRAEANLTEAHRILVEAGSESHPETVECAQALVNLYTAWNDAEPGSGYDAKAEELKMRIKEAKSDSSHGR